MVWGSSSFERYLKKGNEKITTEREKEKVAKGRGKERVTKKKDRENKK